MAVVNLEILLKLPKNPGDGESVHVIDEVDVSQDGDGDPLRLGHLAQFILGGRLDARGRVRVFHVGSEFLFLRFDPKIPKQRSVTFKVYGWFPGLSEKLGMEN